MRDFVPSRGGPSDGGRGEMKEEEEEAREPEQEYKGLKVV